MIKIENIDDMSVVLSNENQILEFSEDGMGDYYINLISGLYPKRGSEETFEIGSDSKRVYDIFSSLLDCIQKIKFCGEQYEEPSHYDVDLNYVKVYDQNHAKTEASNVLISSSENKIQLKFHCGNSSSSRYMIKIIGLGRADGRPYKMPFIDAYDSLLKLSYKPKIITKQMHGKRRISKI